MTEKLARRMRFRFSLRSLLLFVLLLASGVTLWWNWGPWAIAYAIHEPTALHGAGFTPDGKYSFTVRNEARKADGIFENVVTLRDAMTGEVFRTFRGGQHMGNVSFSPAGHYIQLVDNGYANREHLESHERRDYLWRVDTGESIKFVDLPPERVRIELISERENYVVYQESQGATVSDEYTLARLQGFESLAIAKFKGHAVFSSNEKWLVYEDDDGLYLYSIDKRKVERRIPVVPQKYNGNLAFTRDATKLMFSYQDLDATSWQTKFFSVETGACIATLSGKGYEAGCLSNDSDHVILYDLRKSRAVRISDEKSIPLPDSSYFLDDTPISACSADPLTIWDVETGAIRWQAKGEGWVSNDNTYARCTDKNARLTILDAKTGKELFASTPYWEKNGLFASWLDFDFGKHGQFLTCAFQTIEGQDPEFGNTIEDWKLACIWHLRRPVEWWGIAWLPEFWIAAFFAGAFVWSVVRELKPRTLKP